MEPLEGQSDFEVKPAYFDPDALDMSEQQFVASLETEIEKPTFVVDEAEGRLAGSEAGAPIEASAQTETRLDDPRGSGETDSRDTRIPTVGDIGRETELTEAGPDWRDQVSAKVNNYRSRKSPKVRYPSLQLQFEPPAPRGAREVGLELPIENAARDAKIPQGQPIAQTFVSLEATARVFEFPRAAPPILIQEELADPVLDRPRIVEAPALLPPPPALGGILIEDASEQEPERRPGFDMPLQSAPLSRRFLAGAIDGLLVAGSLTAFGYIFVQFNAPIQQSKPELQVAATLAAILWPAYQYAFLVFTGSTPGLRLTKLTVTRFDGTLPSRSLRRWRVLASLLSCVPFGLGYAWCFLDEDQLSWHDRITRTHLAPVNSPVIPEPGMLNS